MTDAHIRRPVAEAQILWRQGWQDGMAGLPADADDDADWQRRMGIRRNRQDIHWTAAGIPTGRTDGRRARTLRILYAPAQLPNAGWQRRTTERPDAPR